VELADSGTLRLVVLVLNLGRLLVLTWLCSGCLAGVLPLGCPVAQNVCLLLLGALGVQVLPLLVVLVCPHLPLGLPPQALCSRVGFCAYSLLLCLSVPGAECLSPDPICLFLSEASGEWRGSFWKCGA